MARPKPLPKAQPTLNQSRRHTEKTNQLRAEADRWAIGLDGRPLDPGHPVYRVSEVEWRERVLREQRDYYKAKAATLETYFMGTSNKRGGRHAKPERALRQAMLHYARWAAVTELHDRQHELAKGIELAEKELGDQMSDEIKYFGQLVRSATTFEARCEAVAELLKSTEARGSAKSMAYSYRLIRTMLQNSQRRKLVPLF